MTIPAGTPVHFKLLRTISTNKTKTGDVVQAALTAPIVVQGVTVAKAGSPAMVRVAEAEESGRIGGSAKLRLRLASITLANNHGVIVKSTSWVREGKAHAKHNATYIVGGAVAGALAGQAIGRDRNATAKGTAAGAGVGIAAAAATGKFDFSVEAGTRFVLKLRESIHATI